MVVVVDADGGTTTPRRLRVDRGFGRTHAVADLIDQLEEHADKRNETETNRMVVLDSEQPGVVHKGTVGVRRSQVHHNVGERWWWSVSPSFYFWTTEGRV